MASESISVKLIKYGGDLNNLKDNIEDIIHNIWF